MKIVKIALRYLMYGFFLFILTGFMFNMIKYSNTGDNSKKIFDESRNFAKVPKIEYSKTTKDYVTNKITLCSNAKREHDKYSQRANQYDMESSKSACDMTRNLKIVVNAMENMKKYSCSEYNKFTYNTYANLLKMSSSKCEK